MDAEKNSAVINVNRGKIKHIQHSIGCDLYAKGGKRTLKEALASAEMAASALFPRKKEEKLEDITQILIGPGSFIR